MDQLLDLSRRLSESRNERLLAELVVSETIRLCAADGGAFGIRTDRGLIATHQVPDDLLLIERLDDGIIGRAADTGRPLATQDALDPALEVAGFLAAVPMTGSGRVHGVLIVHRRKAPFEQADIDIMMAVAPIVATTLTSLREMQQMSDLAHLDDLTGLHNRRSFDRALSQELAYPGSTALVMIDVDHFKTFNDTNGHAGGDEVLRGVGRILRETVRPSDAVFRYGGEEFAIVLSDTAEPDACIVAERVRSAIEAEDFPGDSSQPTGCVTASFGVAVRSDGSPGRLIEAADQALYRAKQTGRNRVSTERATQFNGSPSTRPTDQQAPSLDDYSSPASSAVRRASVAPEISGISPGNLPSMLTPLIGRDDDLAKVTDLVEGNRLVTLTGVGGVGKTRLALAVADETANDYTSGAWFCPLANTSSPLLAASLAESLGITEGGDGSVEETLLHVLSLQRHLLVIDNCEHVVDAARDLVDLLLDSTPGVRILATSRECFGNAHEQVFRVRPLDLTAVAATDNADLNSPAAQLFVTRAQAVRSGLDLDDEARAAVHTICREVAGIPLALELAAQKARLLPLPELASRLRHDLRVLSSGRNATGRHETLTNTIEWSYRLLDEDEATLFRRLSVFAGRTELRDIHEVADVGDDEIDTVDVLDGLVAKSMVLYDPGSDTYRVLEPLRRFGKAKLAEHEEGT